MIYVKHYTRKIRNYRDSSGHIRPQVTAHYTGWFLFGAIPVYVERRKVTL